jgi:hypothetical protein
MENRTQKPVTDLERIQQSYSSGSQSYVSVGSASETHSEAPKESKRDLQCQTPPQE